MPSKSWYDDTVTKAVEQLLLRGWVSLAITPRAVGEITNAILGVLPSARIKDVEYDNNPEDPDRMATVFMVLEK